MDNLSVSKVKKLLNRAGLMAVAQVPINDDDVVSFEVPKAQVLKTLSNLEGKTKTRWSYLEEENLLIMG